jgi:cytochrome c biogenesis protein CcdA
MLRLIGVVISIGLADSMNPSTIGPALYLASGEAPIRELTRFTLGVFATSLAGGALIVLGPGEALLALVPHPGATVRYVLELVAGLAMLVAAVVLWVKRDRLGHRERSQPRATQRSSAILGVTIVAIELPTAFPYFAAIAAVVGSGLGLGRQLILLVLYNACFVSPLLLMITVVAMAGARAQRILTDARDWLHGHWPVLLAALALGAGVFVAVLGVTGLTGATHGTVGSVSRRIRRVIQ